MPIDSEAAAAMDEAGCHFPTDVFVEIPLRLPPSSRRRLRLVCRLWRDTINERTPERQSRAKTLAFATDIGGSRPNIAYVFDELPEGRSRQVWTSGTSTRYYGMGVVGSCNGLLCRCTRYGDITLSNPVTSETLAVPPPPSVHWKGYGIWPEAFSFAYHPTAGQYKIVHVPAVYHNPSRTFEIVEVFTLGDASWQEVSVPGSCCCLSHGLISIDGVTYWFTKGTEGPVL